MNFKEWLLAEGSVEVGQIITVTDRRNGQSEEYRVLAIRGDKVYLWNVRYGEPKGLNGTLVMPLTSVAHFVNDLVGKVDSKKRSGDPAIDAVLDGKAEFIGKGDDGVVFAVGEEIVKMSTTVPYVPSNPGHRYPSEAARMIYTEVRNAQALQRAGVPCILPYRLKIVGEKAFLVHPKVEIVKKLTPEQLDEVRESIRLLHANGWSYNDEIQVGIWNGKVYYYDLGKIKHSIGKFEEETDMSYLELLYSRNGHQELFVPVGRRLKALWDELVDMDGMEVMMAMRNKRHLPKYMKKLDRYYEYVKKELSIDAEKDYQKAKENVKLEPDAVDEDWD